MRTDPYYDDVETLVEMQTVIFRRAEGWYPINIKVGDDIAKHAELNPGTLVVEDIVGNVLWRARS